VAKKIVFVGDWSNLKRSSGDNNYPPEKYDKKAGFDKLKRFLDEIGTIIWYTMYTPLHDVYGNFEFLSKEQFTIVLCPIIASTSTDTTDPKLIKDSLLLIDNFDTDVFCLGSGDHHFREVLETAKKKGLKVAIVYGSRRSLSPEIRVMADVYPDDHIKAGQPMLHLFSPTNE